MKTITVMSSDNDDEEEARSICDDPPGFTYLGSVQVWTDAGGPVV